MCSAMDIRKEVAQVSNPSLVSESPSEAFPVLELVLRIVMGSSDPQGWLFPPSGAADLPSSVSAAFGPVRRGDQIDLRWAPAGRRPAINMACGMTLPLLTA